MKGQKISMFMKLNEEAKAKRIAGCLSIHFRRILLFSFSVLLLFFLSSCYFYTRVGDALDCIGTQVPDYPGTQPLEQCKFWKYNNQLYVEIPYCWENKEAPALFWFNPIFNPSSPMLLQTSSPEVEKAANAHSRYNRTLLVSTHSVVRPSYIFSEDFEYDKAMPINVTPKNQYKELNSICELRDGKYYVQTPYFGDDWTPCENYTWVYYAMRPLVYAGYIADIPLSITLTALSPVTMPICRVINTNRRQKDTALRQKSRGMNSD